jgi:hypothetical protein
MPTWNTSGPKQYIIKQLTSYNEITEVGELLQLHPQTDSDIVLFNITDTVYTSTNIYDLLNNEILNKTSEAQTKLGELTLQGNLILNSDSGPSLEILSTPTAVTGHPDSVASVTQFIFTSGGNTTKLGWETPTTNDVTILFPNLEDHPLYDTQKVFTLATTDDVPPIEVIDGVFDFTYIDDKTSAQFGQLFFNPYTDKAAGTAANVEDGIFFYKGTDAPNGTGRLNLNANLYTTNLNVTTKVTTSTFEATSDAIVGGDLLVSTDLEVDGTSQFDGNVTVTGTNTLTVSGLSKLNGGIEVNGTGTEKFTVDTSGNTDIKGTLKVLGVSTLTGLLNANGGIDVSSGEFTVDGTNGNTYIDGTLDINGITRIAEDLLAGLDTTDYLSSAFAVDVDNKNAYIGNDLRLGGDLYVKGGAIYCDSPGQTFSIQSSNTNPQGATLNLGSQVIGSGASRTINIGTGGLAGSSTTVNIGSAQELEEDSIINLYGTVNIIGEAGTSIVTDTLEVIDNEIILNSNATSPIPGTSGIVVNRGSETNATLYWDETDGK